MNERVLNEPIILASGSPRRRELLEAMGVRFEVMTADVQELEAESAPNLEPVELAIENALLKAQAVARLRPDRFVLGADTVVALGKVMFGKPASLDQAREFLRMLSGQTHEVITGCALIVPKRATETFHEVTRVTFHDLSEETIERYLAAVHVLDKAGAYALQEQGDWIIQRVEGSRDNVIGLPTGELEKVLLRHSAPRA